MSQQIPPEIKDLIEEIQDHATASLNESFDNDNNPDTKLCMAVNQLTLIAEKTKRLMVLVSGEGR